jgi:hypothetical protein
MSGPSLLKTLNNAFGTIGKVVGFQCELYRPDNFMNPLQERNFIGFIKASTTPDDSFSQHGIDELAKYKVYANASNLQVGDILRNPLMASVYIVIAKEELRPCTAVLTTNLVNVLRPSLTSGDRKTIFTAIAENVPAAVKVVGASQTPGALQGMGSNMSSSNSELEVWTWTTPGTFKLNDVIEFDSQRFLITFCQSTASGTIVRARSTKTGV